MTPNQQTIQKIRKLRELYRLTQEKVATTLHITQNGYSKIERGQTELTLNKFASIAKVFNMTMQEILDLDENLLLPTPPTAASSAGNEQKLLEEYVKTLLDKIKLLEEKVDFLEKELQQNRPKE